MNYYIVTLKIYKSYNNPKHIKSQCVESVYNKPIMENSKPLVIPLIKDKEGMKKA